MANSSVHEQLVFLRKQKGLTQEELAQVFGVTNQAVSKWESGACCPDISLLPELADFFGVSIDSFFGRCEKENSFEDLTKKIKALFLKTPENECFDLAYKLAFYLHEGACSKGYKGYIPWDADKERKTDEEYYKWGSSVASEPDGVTVMKGNTVLISSQKHHHEFDGNELMDIWSEIQRYADIERLTVFLALYELTREDYNLFVDIETVADKARLG